MVLVLIVSRIRQIKPSWFLDKQLRRGTTAEAREFYIGLWMLADDDGWIEWDPDRIAAELFPYEGVARRERNIVKWADQLERLDAEHPHLVVLTCGHATVPKMKAHQRIAGNRTTRVHDEHVVGCRGAHSRLSLQGATGSPGIGRVGNGTVGNGIDAGAGAPSGAPPASEFEAGLAAAGGVTFRRRGSRAG